ncbi:MAG: HIT domain-containing protein [Candidatus Moraniibacteriota bacterium]
MRILDKKRKNYQRAFSQKSECAFCDEGEMLICSELSNDQWRVIINLYPYMDGNVMVVPVRHIEDLADISEEEWKSFGKTLSKTKEVLGDIFETDSFNVGLNIGEESGASIAHLHWQVIPRKFKNITVMNTFADLYIVKTPPEETKRLIEEYFSKKKA